jgi:hypothetical protein
LFEAAVFENGVPNPHHLSTEAYWRWRGPRRREARAATACRRAGSLSRFPAGALRPPRSRSLRPARRAPVSATAARERIPVEAKAMAEITPGMGVAYGVPTHGSGGGYDGPLAYRTGRPTPLLFSAL